MRGWYACIGMAAVVVFAAGCTSGGSPTPVATPSPAGTPSTGFKVVATDTDPPLLLLHNRTGGTDATVRGELGYLEEARCFVLGPENVESADAAANRFAVVWPEGTKPIKRADGRFAVDVPGVGEVVEGQWLDGGGGYHTESLELPDVPAECLSSYGEYVFVERIAEVSDEPLAADPWQVQ